MNKKFIKTILILLIITVIIFAIIAAFNIRRDQNTGFSSSTNYSQTTTKNNNTIKKQETSRGYEIGNKSNPVLDFSNHFVILLIGSIFLGILFILFYIFLNRKKEW